ncbi:MAG: ABC transporter ATP-binding protein/permease [Burkholderiaceae bacterium]|nr:ABC transporter ATP-binding protein/permease [Burkholderiaceae bacterium]
MRRRTSTPEPRVGAAAPAPRRRGDWQTIRLLIPYLWRYRVRVLLALGFLIAAKVANVGVPVVLKGIVDALTPGVAATIAAPLALVVAYGLLRLSTTLFTELRELIFARVTERAVRTIALQVFGHLHALSLRFHLDRQTGGLTRDIERGTRAISTLVSFTLYSILPTLVEISMVIGYLALRYDPWFSLIAIGALAVYVVYTVIVTEWRTHFRRTMNELDSKANTRAIDSLLNYETVKYFGNERFEAERYDDTLGHYERARLKSQASLSLLNVGQSAIIAAATTLIVWRATLGVASGRMTLGDLVLVNGFMIQLYIPLNFLGTLYREIKQSLTDLEKMFGLLDANREIDDAPGAKALTVAHALGPRLRFDHVHFSYDAARPILHGIDFSVAPGSTTAVVGASGAGKSTLSRLLFRFYDVTGGRILIDGQDLREVTQDSLRAAVGIVPQDTVLFNDTIGYNIAYGRPGADRSAILDACRSAQLDALVAALPEGLDTRVGERGLKLSGGEKQRVAIARMLLKDPAILILDEATSALDTRNEQAIQGALRAVAAGRTTLVIAHRLSTVVDADQIIVLDHGRIVERGTHAELLAREGVYARMWAAQAQERERI